jgi:cytochrome P450 family 138
VSEALGWGSTATAVDLPVRLPPRPACPDALLTLAYLTRGRWLMKVLGARFGGAFSMRLPAFGPTVFISDPALVKELFRQPHGVVGGVEPNLGMILGPGSTFSLQGAAHRRRRKLVVPPFQGDRMRAYAELIERETLAETASWPDDEEFAALPSMMRITLSVILRAVLGAEGAELAQLRILLPGLMSTGQRLALAPWLQHDLGRWSPWHRYLSARGRFDAVIESLICRAESDPRLADRTDVLAQLLRARDDDGNRMSNAEVADELLTFVVAGHETTATTLGWAVERLRRHPGALADLSEAIDSGDEHYLQATVHEVQRVRPVIGAAARQVVADSVRLGPWVIPRGHTISVPIELVHGDASAYASPERFDPERFVGRAPDGRVWVPYGGGSRRCPGAAFANLEIQIVLRTIMRQFRITPTTARDEGWHMRGVAFAPSRGGRIRVHRRREAPGS